MHSYFCLSVCPVATTTVSETTRLACQTVPVLSPVLALLGGSDAITVPAFLGLEQLFAKLRIAGGKGARSRILKRFVYLVAIWGKRSQIGSPTLREASYALLCEKRNRYGEGFRV
jgi:hypothetical protein